MKNGLECRARLRQSGRDRKQRRRLLSLSLSLSLSHIHSLKNKLSRDRDVEEGLATLALNASVFLEALLETTREQDKELSANPQTPSEEENESRQKP